MFNGREDDHLMSCHNGLWACHLTPVFFPTASWSSTDVCDQSK